MAAIPPSNSNPAGDEPKSAAIPLTFDEKLNQFWQKNRAIVLGLCVFVLLAILGKGLWEHLQRQKEAETGQAYANANTPEQLRAFASAHPGHALAGIAELRIADEAYAAGKAGDAVAGYDKAVAIIKDGPLAGRALLGRGLAKVLAGKATDGAADLKQVANDARLLKAVRAEAAYHLASLAADGGNSADVQKYIEQLNQIDAASMWARRAVDLQASLPKPAPSSASAPSTPAKEASAPNLQIKLPGK